MESRVRAGLLASGLAVICGCTSLPDRVDSLEQARAQVLRLEQDRLASEVAAAELAAAREAIAQAEDAFAKKARLEIIEHKAYVAQRYAEISKQRIREAHAREQLAEGELERNRILMQARERKSERADLQAAQPEPEPERTAAARQ
jgi:hypothetical protein